MKGFFNRAPSGAWVGLATDPSRRQARRPEAGRLAKKVTLVRNAALLQPVLRRA